MNKPFIYISKTLVVVVITLIVLIGTRKSTNFKTELYKKVYDTNIDFAYINVLYTKYFGSSIPLANILKKDKMVFNEKLQYKSSNKYLDGGELEVDTNYTVPTLNTGLITFVGEKDGYGNTVIVNQVNGIDVWYGNLDIINVKLYDYIEAGTYIGNVSDNKLYIVFKRHGDILNYEEYIK